MEISVDILKRLRSEYGEAFYLLDSDQFRSNFFELKGAFTKIYRHFNIAYSYKTNYTPKLCKIVNELGGYAEVVSDMEVELALKIGVPYEKIIWNGPIKKCNIMESFLICGGTVNIDSLEECVMIQEMADNYPNYSFHIGIRCNFDVKDGVLSRFGLDVDGEDFKHVLDFAKNTPNVVLINLQCHFAKRQVEYWPARVKGMMEIIDHIGIIPNRIDLGGGIFGKMEDSLKSQFSTEIPGYEKYAEIVATVFEDRFKNEEKKPELLIEPGSALVGDCMKFVGTIHTIKKVRGKTIISVMGSQKNINMTGVNPPMKLYAMGNEQNKYEFADLAGFTCIEDDILYNNYTGKAAKGDMVVFSNCGSYSLVMKPPFILPNFPVLDICEENVEVIKREETFNDVFHTFNF